MSKRVVIMPCVSPDGRRRVSRLAVQHNMMMLEYAPGDRVLIDDCVYVLCDIHAKESGILLKSQARVCGEEVFAFCLENQFPFPSHDQPVIFLCLRDTLVCASQLDATEKSLLQALVHYLGGDFTSDLTVDVTHLVTHTVNSDKYRRAVQNNITVVRPEWIVQCWKHKTKLNSNDFLLPVFSGLNICLAEFDEWEGPLLKDVLVTNGATVHEEVLAETTVLVTPHTGHEQHTTATNMNVPFLVTPQWIYASLKERFMVDPSEFPVPSIAIAPMLVDPTPSRASQGLQVPSSQRFRASQVQVGLVETSCCFLEGVRALLLGFQTNSSRLIEATETLRRGGATRVSVPIASMANYVVVGDESQQKLTQLVTQLQATLAPDVCFVRYHWLRDCLAARRKVDVEPKHSITVAGFARSAPQTLPTSSANGTSRTGTATLKRSMSASQSVMNFMSDYTAGDVVARRSSLSKSHDDGETVRTLELLCEDSCMDASQMDSATQKGLLVDHSFYLHGFNERERAKLEKDICKEDGQVVTELGSSSEPKSWCVCPHGTSPPSPCSWTIITSDWVNACVKKRDILDVSTSAIFRPVYRLEGAQDLTFTTTEFKDEREYVNRLVSLIGASIQTMMRKSITTHVLAKVPQGQKVALAARCGIPVVKVGWLEDSVKEGRLLPIEGYTHDLPEVTPSQAAPSHIPSHPQSPTIDPTPNPVVVPETTVPPTKSFSQTDEASKPSSPSLVSPPAKPSPSTPQTGSTRFSTPQLPTTPDSAGKNTPGNRRQSLRSPPFDPRNLLQPLSSTRQTRSRVIQGSSRPTAQLPPSAPDLFFRCTPRDAASGAADADRDLDADLSDSQEAIMQPRSQPETQITSVVYQDLEEARERELMQAEQGDGESCPTASQCFNTQRSNTFPASPDRSGANTSTSFPTPTRPHHQPRVQDPAPTTAPESEEIVLISPHEGHPSAEVTGQTTPTDPGKRTRPAVTPSSKNSARSRKRQKGPVECSSLCFVTSGLKPEKKEQVKASIKSFGAHMCEQPWLSEKVTHLVCDRLTRTEKILSACLKGVSIVNTSFLSKRENLEEGLELSHTVDEIGKNSEGLVDAVEGWRAWHRTHSVPPLADVRALVDESGTDPASVCRILDAGGASVQRGAAFNDRHFSSATHLITHRPAQFVGVSTVPVCAAGDVFQLVARGYSLDAPMEAWAQHTANQLQQGPVVISDGDTDSESRSTRKITPRKRGKTKGRTS